MKCLNVETHTSIPTKTPIISSNTSSLTNAPSKIQANKAKNNKTNYVENQHQQIRNFINSSSYLSRRLNNSSNHNTTVRINPLLLKRPFEASSQAQQSSLYKKQQKSVKPNNSSCQMLYKNPVMYTNQEIDQIQNQQFNQSHLEQSDSSSFLNNTNNTNNFLLGNSNELSDYYSNQFVQTNDYMQNTNKITTVNDSNLL
jgi:hypothetical protein